MNPLIEPKEITLHTESGEKRIYILSKLDCIEGREFIFQYPISALPKLGNYALNKELMLMLMKHVAVPTENGPLRLSTEGLVRNHAREPHLLIELEKQMIGYNFRFLLQETIWPFLKNFQNQITASIIKTLTDLSAQFSPKAAPPSKNSEPFTA